MTDRAQFEAMLEALINDDQETAKEIFHNIVVGKSREIYEELLAEDFSADEANKHIGSNSNPHEEEEEEEEEEESVGDEEEEEEKSDDMDDKEPDDMDDMDDMDDKEPDDMGDEDDGDIEDRVMDLEDALEDLKAEFEQLLQGEEHEEGDHPGIHGDVHMGDIEGEMDESDPTMMMEYYKKVSVTHGDNGQNTKSTVAGKNDMGGTTANIAKSFSTTSGGTQGGLAKPTAGDLTSGLGHVHNRKDSNAGKTAFKKQEPGHGPEKKGKGETQVNAKSTISTRVR